MKFEEYINKNRDKFDIEEPDRNMLWEPIRKELYHSKSKLIYTILKIAASIILIVGISTIIFLKRNIPMYNYSYQLGKKERAYIQSINHVKKKAAYKQIYRSANHEIINSLIKELEYIDTIYEEVMNDLRKSGYVEESVSIIFDTYEKKIEILEKIILEKEKINHYEKNKEHIML